MTDDQVNLVVQHLCEQLHLALRLKGSEAHPPNAKDIGFDRFPNINEHHRAVPWQSSVMRTPVALPPNQHGKGERHEKTLRAHRETLLRDIASAGQHIAQSDAHISKQEALIAGLDRDGNDTSVARALLNTMRDTRVLHLQHRGRILKELAR